ncbi:MAG: NAD(P)-dependent oxidoreductase [Candidatus Aegiribacteria sp.]|nr:NAD(P)-dependent oxidoreductase [Candidatus Aegiribacteria sp.]
MKVMIAGAGGFIGSAISEYLKNVGHDVFNHIRSINSEITFDSLPADVDVIVNAAGKLGIPGVDINKLKQSNTILPSILADFCAKHRIHLIHLSTPGVIGLYANVSENSPFNPWGDYEKTKKDGEVILRKHIQLPPEKLTILRPDFVYGPGDLHKLELFRQVDKGWIPLIGRNGARLRPTFSEDVCRAVESSLPGGRLNGGLYNIGGPEIVTFREFTREISDALGKDMRCISIPRLAFRIGLLLGPLRPKALSRSRFRLFGEDHYVSIDKAASVGFSPSWRVSDGIARTVSWYQNMKLLSL